MKRSLTLILAASCFVSISCNVGKGCPTSGRSVGAERVLSGDAKTLKAIKKAPKFRS